MDTKKIIITIIVIILLVVGVYFIFFNKKSEPVQNESENTTTAEENSNESTQEYALVDVSFFASEVHDALSKIHNAIIADTDESQEVFATESKRLESSMDELSNIENYIQSLPEEEYSQLKEKWQSFSAEVKSLYENLKNENYVKEEGLIVNDNIHTLFDELNVEFNNILERNNSESSEESSENNDSNNEESNAEEDTENSTEGTNDNIVATYQIN